MNDSIFELILFLVVKNDAFVVDKVEKTHSPNGTTEELNHKVIHPFLNKIRLKLHLQLLILFEIF